MRTYITIIVFYLFQGTVYAQNTIEATLKKFNKNTVGYISVAALLVDSTAVLLDTRKKEEFEVSHLQNAHWVGYQKFDIDQTISNIPDKDTPIVVYCSVGVRSEDIGEKLIQASYTNVKNLYGGIFAWKNQGNPVFDANGNKTEKVHAFSKHWGKLLTNAQNIYTTKSKKLEKTVH
ncbi:MAG: rhodanese-like domain-containing protein [Bacteroidota bacterium]